MAKEAKPLSRLGTAVHDDRPLMVRLLQRGGRWRMWGAALFWYATVVVLLSPFFRYAVHQYREGQIAERDVNAPERISITNRMATERARRQLDEDKVHIWVHDSDIQTHALARLDSFIDLLEKQNPQNARQMRDFLAAVEKQADLALDETMVGPFLPARLHSMHPPLTPREVRDALRRILSLVLGGKGTIYQMDLFEAQYKSKVLEVQNERSDLEPLPDPASVLLYPKEVRDFLQTRELPSNFPGPEYDALRQSAGDLLMKLIEPNITPDEERTRLRYQAQLMLARPIVKDFEPGDPIVKKGEVLSQLQVDALTLIEENAQRLMAVKIIGVMMITAVFFAAVALYLRRFRSQVTLDASMVTLHALPPIMGLAIGQILLNMGYSHEVVMLGFPAAMVGLLSALLLTPQVGFVLVLVGCALFGIATQQDFSFLIYALFGGFAAVLASRSVRVRGQVLVVGAQVGVVNMATIVMLDLLTIGKLPTWRILGYGFLNGLICAFVTLLLLVVFERVFDIVTDIRLLELTGIKNKLISEFEEKAPGSYQHVLSVTKLAEAASDAIGANTLLVRAGAYFHDVGKMIKPKYYSENQVTLDDKKIHSRLSPYMSVLIIKNHVKEGIELARKAGLPEKIVEFIPQHHGTSLIRYFYTEALRRYEDSEAVDPVHEEDFRYPGPKPQSIEAAIVLLADSVEAISSSKFVGGQVNENELRRTVQNAILEKFNDFQFDECDLTMRHLFRMREAFVRALMARYHFRIAYPTPVKRDASQQPATAA